MVQAGTNRRLESVLVRTSPTISVSSFRVRVRKMGSGWWSIERSSDRECKTEFLGNWIVT